MSTVDLRIVDVADGVQFLKLLNDHLHLNDRKGIPCPYCGTGDDRFYIRTDPGNSDFPVTGAMRVRFICREATRRKHAGEPVDHGPAISAAQVLEDRAGIVVNADDWDFIADSMPILQGRTRYKKNGVDGVKTYTQEDITADHIAGCSVWHDHSVFDDITIKTFRLGVRQWRNGVQRLTIPIQIPLTHAPEATFILKGRRFLPHDTLPQKYDAPAKMDPYLFQKWVRRDGTTIDYSPVIHIAEGEKSTIALWQMGLAPVATTTAGSDVWEDDWSREILERGVVMVNIYGDDDTAGDSFVKTVRRSFLRVKDEFPEIDTLTVRALAWPDFDTGTGRSKKDPYDILAEWGSNAGAIISKMLANAKDLVDPKVGLMRAEIGPIMDLDVIRGEGPDSLYGRFKYFYENFRKEFYSKEDEELDQPETSTALVDRSFAGSGKTRAAVRLVEEAALDREEQLQRRDERKQQHKEEAERILARYEAGELDLTDDDLALFKRRVKYKPSERTAFLYIAPFKRSWEDILRIRQHPKLWFPLEARSTSNCKYYDTQARIAAKGYTVMNRLCKGSCPFREMCAEQPGQYMQQFEELYKYPIVFLRHPHLLMRDLTKRAKLVIIDEDPNAEYMKQLRIDDSDFDTEDSLRDLLVDFSVEETNAVIALADALKRSLGRLASKSKDILYRAGPDVLRLVNAQLSTSEYGVHTLESLAEAITPEVMERLDTRTPEALLNPDTIQEAPSGYFVDLLRVVLEEAQEHYHKLYEDPDYRWNSRVNIIGHNYAFYPMTPFPIPMKTPVIALDATGSPVKYKKSLGRDILDNKSLVREPATATFVFMGSGFSISAIRKDAHETSAIPADLLKNEWAAVARAVIEGNDEAAEDALDADALEQLDLNAAISDALKVIQQIAVRHDNLFVVTYKALEKKLKDEMWKISVELSLKLEWGHFRALRGSNEFEHMDAVLIIGTPRPPLVETAMALSALFHDEELLDLSLGRVALPYHSTGALPGAKTTMFADPRTHDFINELEAGEIEQDLARIRPHTSKRGKFVYLLTERPAAPWVTHMVDYRKVVEQFDIQAGAMVAAKDGARTISRVQQVLSSHTGKDIGEARSRKIAAYIKDPLMLRDWTDQAILPDDAYTHTGDQQNG